MNETAATRDRAVWHAALALGVLLIVVTAIILGGSFWGDPTIYLPYARNAAAGDFFSYNPGQFSSGSTSPLWGLILSIPFTLGAGVAGARVVAVLATVGAFLAVAAASARIGGRTPGNGLVQLFVVEMLTIYGLMMYESPLVVAGVAASILVGLRTMDRWRHRGRLDLGSFWPLVLVWAMLPLARPDATILVPLQIAAMWLAGPQRSGAALTRLIAAATLAAVPSALYFGSSLALLGMVSVSSAGRAFALKESADRFGPILFSRVALSYLGSILYMIALAAVGHDVLRREGRHAWLALLAVGSVVSYVIMLVFVSPVTNDLPRYFLPIAPFLVIGAGVLLSRAPARPARRWAAAVGMALLLFIVKPAGAVLGEAWSQSQRGYHFDEIVERDAMSIVNRLANPGDTLLAYEVQDRFALRPDVAMLSLDGITDGLVTPYLASADMGAFIRKHRPAFWLANDAVEYRPYLRRSILHSIMHEALRDSLKTTIEREGIRFTVVARRQRPMPRGFAGWRLLFRLDYLESRAQP